MIKHNGVDNGSTKMLHKEEIIPDLVKTVQYLMNKVETLESQINNLQNKEVASDGVIKSHFDVTVNMSDQDWHNMISVHLNGTFFCTREALKIMNNQNSGCIINMGSVLGTTGGPSSPHYSAAKAAILGYTRATARELASRNIRVNAIAVSYTHLTLPTNREV